MIIGPRGPVRFSPALRPGFGSSRTWRRVINGTPYRFVAVLMPDGERRYFVDRFNGYCGGEAFGCAWDAHCHWTIKP